MMFGEIRLGILGAYLKEEETSIRCFHLTVSIIRYSGTTGVYLDCMYYSISEIPLRHILYPKKLDEKKFKA